MLQSVSGTRTQTCNHGHVRNRWRLGDVSRHQGSVGRQHARTDKRTDGDPDPSHVPTHNQHIITRKDGGGFAAQGLAQKTLCPVPAASPGGPQKTSPDTSNNHVPVSRPGGLPLSGREKGGNRFGRATVDYKGIALQREDSRRKPKRNH